MVVRSLGADSEARAGGPKLIGAIRAEFILSKRAVMIVARRAAAPSTLVIKR